MLPAVLTDFYGSFASISFTILGLWFVVAQTRYADWMASPEHRRRASAVSLHFALPGLMSLLSLSDPQNAGLWRVTFTLAGALGAVGLAVVNRGPSLRRGGPIVRVIHWVSVALYALIAAVALAPGALDDLNVTAAPLRVEAILLSLLVFLGVTLAWLLMFEPGDDAPEAAPPPADAS
ncbi:MAG: hypothetical protein QOG82_1294 [Actinomycetota bacterium]|jgi:hypothetical protein|nr:hypothetical protein [Actinomycetota bacterium]